eukprot:m.1173184 g.1173184  ORF g.1173184 m.1173184 type:complete len:80 (-) comp24520_c0_seq8:51-290(-)
MDAMLDGDVAISGITGEVGAFFDVHPPMLRCFNTHPPAKCCMKRTNADLRAYRSERTGKRSTNFDVVDYLDMREPAVSL